MKKVHLNKQTKYLYSFGANHVAVSCTQTNIEVGTPVVFCDKEYVVKSKDGSVLTLAPV